MKIYLSRVTYPPVIFAALWLTACSGAKPEPAGIATSTPPSSRSGGQKTQSLASERAGRSDDKSSLEALRRGEAPTSTRDSALKEVYFDFDRYDLDSEDRAILRANADWLKKNTAAGISIEGHTDEQGSSEYNLALGAKRAQAAKDYLTTLGVAASRISTTSFGEEIPVCREHQESCWRTNRRDRFVVLRLKPGA